jgi:hypothetical protein
LIIDATFSLGAVLYQMATETRPFDGVEGDVIAHILDEPHVRCGACAAAPEAFGASSTHCSTAPGDRYPAWPCAQTWTRCCR